jgi:dinuclear metal center YbgI/SA1388 family protein
MKVRELNDYLLSLYPLDLASSFDQGKMGLQIGAEEDDITGVLITLDVTGAVIDEAVRLKSNVIISHHPFMFDPLLRISYNDAFGTKLVKVIINRLNIINMHTNYDSALGGMNDELANQLDLKDIRPYFPEPSSDNFLRIGKIEPQSLESLVRMVKSKLNLPMTKVIGDLKQPVSIIGIVGGSGGSEINHALSAGCDVLITGEVKQNQALLAKEKGLSVIEVTHFVEHLYKEPLKKRLSERFKNLKVSCALDDVDSFRYV